MLAFLLALGIFCYFWFVGAAIGFACIRRRWSLQTMLVAPTIGYSAVITTAVCFNFVGLPIDNFAVPLVIAFGVAAAGLLWRLRPALPWRQYAPYALVLGAVFISNGIPLLRFGFDWVSVSNNDAAGYATDAYRLMHFGFWVIPPFSELLSDASPFAHSYYHYGQFAGGFYHGFDVTLGTVARVTGLNTFQVYMPVMATGLLSLASAGGALLLYRGFGRSAPVVACLGAGLSSLTTLGYIYQLGPQEFALSAFVSGIALLTNARAYSLTGLRLAGYAGLAALPIAGLNVTYNAFQIMLAPALLTFLGLSVFRREIRLLSALRFSAVVALFAVALTNVNLQAVKSSVAFALTFSGGHLRGAAAFPFFVVPTGLANFWGLYPIAHAPHDPLLSAGIAAGGLILMLAIAASAWLGWQGLGAAIVSAEMFCMVGIAAAEQGDFALFKLSMYLQPFLWATLTAACFVLIRRFRPWGQITHAQMAAAAATPVVLLTVYGLAAQQLYIARSEDLPGSYDITFVIVQHASSSHLLTQLTEVRRQAASRAVVLDTDSPALGIYESFYLYGRQNFAPSANQQKFICTQCRYVSDKPQLGLIHWAPRAAHDLAELAQFLVNGQFNLEPQKPLTKVDLFAWYRFFDRSPVAEPVSILITTPRQTVLNRSHAATWSGDVQLVDAKRISNHLVLLNGTYGAEQGTYNRTAALYSLDNDLYYRGGTFSAVGRYLLFYIINPTKPLRLVVDITATIDADGRNAIPPATIIGRSKVKLDAAGRGSARLFSPAFRPQELLGHAYTAIDMGSDGTRFPDHKTGLMRLYGLDQHDDPRLFVGFARNISAISDDEYDHLVPPVMLVHFPQDLGSQSLEYSGIYEDGWLSENSYAVLSASRQSHVEIAGTVPDIGDPGFRTEARLSVDGREVERETLGVGTFAISAGDVPPGRHRVLVRFSRWQALPHGDRRIVVALLSKYGFVAGKAGAATHGDGAAQKIRSDIPVASGIEIGSDWGAPERYAQRVFRWCASEATLHVAPSVRDVTLVLEPGPGVSRLPLRLDVTDAHGRALAALKIPGYERITIPLPKNHSTIVNLRAENGGSHISSDPRILDFRVFSVASI